MYLAGDHHSSAASTATTALGTLLLLPSELLHEILIRLALPELLRVRSVARPLSHLISSPDFRRFYHLSSVSSGPAPAAAWLLVFKKLPPRGAALRGFHGPSGRWFRIPVSDIISPAVPPGEDLYFLAASGSSFLFAANGRRELVVVDLSAQSARRLPPSPLGPRGTSSWRRFGLKLVADPPGSSQFRYTSFSFGGGLWKSSFIFFVKNSTNLDDDDTFQLSFFFLSNKVSLRRDGEQHARSLRVPV